MPDPLTPRERAAIRWGLGTPRDLLRALSDSTAWDEVDALAHAEVVAAARRALDDDPKGSQPHVPLTPYERYRRQMAEPDRAEGRDQLRALLVEGAGPATTSPATPAWFEDLRARVRDGADAGGSRS